MLKTKGFVDLIVISSSDDDESGDVGNEEESDDGGGKAEVVKRKKRGDEGGEKEAGGDVSPSSVEVKTVSEKLEEDDDCCILDFDPFDTAAADIEKKLSLYDGDDKEEEFSILAEKGEVACRDFPHSRHLCVEFLFDKTPHESHCSQCYCYVCDTPAPCTLWEGSPLSHCHASDSRSMWKDLRTCRQKVKVDTDA